MKYTMTITDNTNQKYVSVQVNDLHAIREKVLLKRNIDRILEELG
jgi:hypothetical protein